MAIARKPKKDKAGTSRLLWYAGAGVLALVLCVSVFSFSGSSELQKREEFSDGEIRRMFEGDNLGYIEKLPDDKRRECLERYGKIMGSRGFTRDRGGKLNEYLDTLSNDDLAAFQEGLQQGKEYGKEQAEKRRKEWIDRMENQMLSFAKKNSVEQEQQIQQEVKRISDNEVNFRNMLANNPNIKMSKEDLAKVAANFRKAPGLRPDDEKLLSSKAAEIKRDFDKRLQDALNKLPPVQAK